MFVRLEKRMSEFVELGYFVLHDNNFEDKMRTVIMGARYRGLILIQGFMFPDGDERCNEVHLRSDDELQVLREYLKSSQELP